MTGRTQVLSVDVIYALKLQPGDLYAGNVDMAAPTTPVQPWAAALRLTEVETFRTDERLWVRLTAGAGELSPVPAASQVLVIRGA